MPDVSKLSWRAGLPVLAALLAGVVLAVSIGQRQGGPAAPAGRLDDWDIPRLVAYLNGQGLGLRMVPTRKDGIASQNAFLTTTDQDWADLNDLGKIREQIDRWRGTLYCRQKTGEKDWSDQVHYWGDCCLEAGPFIFFGDRELLARVRAALGAPAPPGDSPPSPPTRPGFQRAGR